MVEATAGLGEEGQSAAGQAGLLRASSEQPLRVQRWPQAPESRYLAPWVAGWGHTGPQGPQSTSLGVTTASPSTLAWLLFTHDYCMAPMSCTA